MKILQLLVPTSKLLTAEELGKIALTVATSEGCSIEDIFVNEWIPQTDNVQESDINKAVAQAVNRVNSMYEDCGRNSRNFLMNLLSTLRNEKEPVLKNTITLLATYPNKKELKNQYGIIFSAYNDILTLYNANLV